MIKKYLNRFPHALRGIKHATLNDSSFRHQIYTGAAIVFIITALFEPLETFELLFILLAWTLILITELQNSALEAALDQVHPELHNNIKVSKDMAAGAVLIAGIFLLVVLSVIIFY